MTAPSLRLLCTLWRHGLVLVALCLWAALSHAQGALQLDDAAPRPDAWPHVTVLRESAERLTVEQAAARREQFVKPVTPWSNLGPAQPPTWLRLPLVTDGDGQWVLQVDYAQLDRIEGWLLADGRVVARATMGDRVPESQHPGASLAHAWPLTLAPGVTHELLLRVQTGSPMIVPLQMDKALPFERREHELLLVQGVAAGVGLCLLIYAWTHWLDSREPVYLWYGLGSAAGTAYFLAFHGIAGRYLAGQGSWWSNQAPPLAGLVAAAAMMMLGDQLLGLRELHRGLSRAARVLAVGLGVAAVLLVTGAIGVAAGQVIGAGAVLLAMAAAVPLSVWRWRLGDRAAPYMLMGWTTFAIGMVPLVLMLRGHLGAEPWIQPGAQLGRLVAMLMWLRMLGLRAGEMRQRALRAEGEQRQLLELAHADALTGLPNRRALDDALERALAVPAPNLAVFLGDLDGFKAVNDRLGHEAGDELLVAAARRLRLHLRRGDLVARLGGDEFVVIAHGLQSEADAERIAQLLSGAFVEPFSVRGEGVRVGLTLGWALAPRDGTQASQLLRHADAQMYAGKARLKVATPRGGAVALN